jgi:putative endonuclease
MYYVYILSSINFSKSYVGCTDDIERRIKEHNSGKMSFTKRYLPWKLKYYETFNSLSEARKRESYFKTGAGRRFMKTLFNN